MCEAYLQSRILDHQGVVLRLVLHPTSDKLAGSLLLDVPQDSEVKFQAPELQVRVAGSTDSSDVLLQSGRYRATETIHGYALAEFAFGLSLPGSPEEIEATFPPIDINGTVVKVSPVVLALQRRAMLVGLCQ